MKKGPTKKIYSGISIDQLLAAPLVAAANANSSMAKKQTIFLMESCFDRYNIGNEDDEDEVQDYVYHPKMVTLSMTKNVIKPGIDKNKKPKMEQISTNFEVPILTLIPFNSLSLKDLSVNLDLEITSQKQKSKSFDDNVVATDEIELKGNVSYESDRKSNDNRSSKKTSKLSVEMNAGSIPLPVGFTTILDLYTKNINSISLDKKTYKK